LAIKVKVKIQGCQKFATQSVSVLQD